MSYSEKHKPSEKREPRRWFLKTTIGAAACAALWFTTGKIPEVPRRKKEGDQDYSAVPIEERCARYRDLHTRLEKDIDVFLKEGMDIINSLESVRNGWKTVPAIKGGINIHFSAAKAENNTIQSSCTIRIGEEMTSLNSIANFFDTYTQLCAIQNSLSKEEANGLPEIPASENLGAIIVARYNQLYGDSDTQLDRKTIKLIAQETLGSACNICKVHPHYNDSPAETADWKPQHREFEQEFPVTLKVYKMKVDLNLPLHITIDNSPTPQNMQLSNNGHAL